MRLSRDFTRISWTRTRGRLAIHPEVKKGLLARISLRVPPRTTTRRIISPTVCAGEGASRVRRARRRTEKLQSARAYRICSPSKPSFFRGQSLGVRARYLYTLVRSLPPRCHFGRRQGPRQPVFVRRHSTSGERPTIARTPMCTARTGHRRRSSLDASWPCAPSGASSFVVLKRPSARRGPGIVSVDRNVRSKCRCSCVLQFTS